MSKSQQTAPSTKTTTPDKKGKNLSAEKKDVFPGTRKYRGGDADEKNFKLLDLIKKLMNPAAAPKSVHFDPKDLHVLLNRVLDVYATRNCALIELSAPVNICGDTHGQFTDLLRIFNACGAPTRHKYLFLGDYVDRGRHSLEVIVLLFCLKLAVPKNVFLLRGNHELKAINKSYGFLAELKNRYHNGADVLHDHFNEVFAWMPLAAVVSKRILCMHGGISAHLKSFDDIRNIRLPVEQAKSHPLACDLLWADPDKNSKGFEFNKMRAISNTFGEKEVNELCQRLDIDLIVRAHQVVEYGYAFFASRKLITVFSASRYQEESHNYAAVVVVSKQLELSFVQLKPEEFEKRRDENEKNNKENQEQLTANVPQ